MNYEILFITLILFPLVDYFYLSNVSSHFSNLVLKITKEPLEFNLQKAIGAYIFLILGIYYFILKDLNQNNYKQKIRDATILGIVIYGTFDFTNGAIFKDYDYKTMLLDTTWGGVLFGLVTYLVYTIQKN